MLKAGDEPYGVVADGVNGAALKRNKQIPSPSRQRGNLSKSYFPAILSGIVFSLAVEGA